MRVSTWPEAILDRIGYSDSTALTIETLSELQHCFLTRVPFENLDIHLARPIRLERTRVLEKVVNERRGGWCFELNEVFFVLLEALGFEVIRCASTVLQNGGDAGELHPFDHVALLVNLSGRRWLVDVGFGDASLTPLDIDRQTLQSDGRAQHVVVPDGNCFRVERVKTAQEREARHRLDPTPREWSAFAQRCAFLQTSPRSAFTQKRLCTRVDDGVTLTLSGNKLFKAGVSEPVPEPPLL